MKNGKIVVLQALGGLTAGGAESRVMDITRQLSHTDITYAFLLHDKGKDFYEDEAQELGCEIYRVPAFRIYNYFSYTKALKKLFAEHPEIDIVQGHITSSAAIYLPIAQKYGVKATIAHGRSAGVDKGIKGTLTKMLRKNLWKKCDYMWACSSEAGSAVFGDERQKSGKVGFIPNAIDVGRFIPENADNSVTSAIKDKYGLNGKFVIGHVGSFRYAKNHEFILDIFNEIRKIKEDAVLFLVGEGSLMNMVSEKARNMGISDYVIFAGNHKDVDSYYQVMDMVIFPSRYEGLPGTIVEAQAAKLPCLISGRITKDVAVTQLVRYESLESSAPQWAQRAMEFYDDMNTEKGNAIKDSAPSILRSKGFDVTDQVKMLEKRYKEMLQTK